MRDFGKIRALVSKIVDTDAALGPPPPWGFGDSPEAKAYRAHLQPLYEVGEEMMNYLLEGVVDDGNIGVAFGQEIQAEKAGKGFNPFKDDLSQISETYLPFLILRYVVVVRKVRLDQGFPVLLRIGREYPSFFKERR